MAYTVYNAASCYRGMNNINTRSLTIIIYYTIYAIIDNDFNFLRKKIDETKVRRASKFSPSQVNDEELRRIHYFTSEN